MFIYYARRLMNISKVWIVSGPTPRILFPIRQESQSWRTFRYKRESIINITSKGRGLKDTFSLIEPLTIGLVLLWGTLVAVKP